MCTLKRRRESFLWRIENGFMRVICRIISRIMRWLHNVMSDIQCLSYIKKAQKRKKMPISSVKSLIVMKNKAIFSSARYSIFSQVCRKVSEFSCMKCWLKVWGMKLLGSSWYRKLSNPNQSGSCNCCAARFSYYVKLSIHIVCYFSAYRSCWSYKLNQ